MLLDHRQQKGDRLASPSSIGQQGGVFQLSAPPPGLVLCGPFLRECLPEELQRLLLISRGERDLGPVPSRRGRSEDPRLTTSDR